MSDIDIQYDETAWQRADTVAIRGDLFVDGSYVGTDCDAFADVGDRSSFEARLNDAAGQFAAIVETPDAVYAAVDHLCSIPLFYGVGDETVHISDDPGYIRDRLGPLQHDPECSMELLLSGYVTGPETLYPEIKQLQPGQLLAVDRDGTSDLVVDQYFSLTDPEIVQRPRSTVLDELDTVMRGAFERLVERADGDPIILSLSGGYDSRLVALLVDAVGYDNVYAFTFPDFLTDGDLEIAETIAGELGIDWTPLEMTQSDFETFYRSDEYESFKRDLDDFASVTPFFFWSLVMKKVQESASLPDDGIVVVGHAISHSTEHLPDVTGDPSARSLDAITDWLWTQHYNLRHIDDRRTRTAMQARIRDRIAGMDGSDSTDVLNTVVDWYWQERTPKFLLRHVEEYGHWGYDRWTPLWDREVAAHWGTVPFEYRRGKDIYEEYIDGLTEARLGDRYAIAGANEGAEDEEASVDLVSVFDSVVSHLPVEAMVRRTFRQWETRKIKESDQYRRYGFLSPEQFDTLHPQVRHVKYYHALEKISRLGCFPPEWTPLSDDVRAFERNARPRSVPDMGESTS